MNKSIEIAWDNDGYVISVTDWDPNTPFGAEPSGKMLGDWNGLSFEQAIERIKEEMIGLLPK